MVPPPPHSSSPGTRSSARIRERLPLPAYRPINGFREASPFPLPPERETSPLSTISSLGENRHLLPPPNTFPIPSNVYSGINTAGPFSFCPTFFTTHSGVRKRFRPLFVPLHEKEFIVDLSVAPKFPCFFRRFLVPKRVAGFPSIPDPTFLPLISR